MIAVLAYLLGDRRDSDRRGTMESTEGRLLAVAVTLGLVLGGLTRARAEASTCREALVTLHQCVATVDYTTPDPGTQTFGHLKGFATSLTDSSFPTNPDGSPTFPAFAGITDSWEESRIQAIGGDAQRWIIRWDNAQPDGATPAFSDRAPGTATPADGWTYVWDRRYSSLLAAGMVPIIAITGTPSWAKSLTSGSSYSVPDLADWDAFIRALAERYPMAVLESFNEPNLWTSAGPDYPIPATVMAQMQQHMYQQVKSVHPHQLVIGPAIATPEASSDHEWDVSTYVRALESNGLAANIDGFTLHPYPGPTVHSVADLDTSTGNGWTSMFADVRSAMAAFGDTHELWVTEEGVTTTGGTWAVDPLAQRDITLELDRRVQGMSDVRAEIFFTLRDDSAAGQSSTSPDYGYGWLAAPASGQSGPGGSPKPVFCAFVAQAGNTFPGC